MKSRSKLAIIAALLLVAPLAACTSPKPAAVAPEVEAVVPDKPDLKEPLRSDRGHLIKTVGEPSGIGPDATSDSYVDFVVTGITVDAPCTSDYSSAPEHGHFIKVDMEVATTPALPQDFLVNVNNAWKWVDANGTTANGDPATGPAYGCLTEGERLPAWVGPGERVTGSLMLDVPTAEGTLVFSQAAGTGWEWAVPAV